MPYIQPGDRDFYWREVRDIGVILPNLPNTPGSLNFVISTLVNRYLTSNYNYDKVNAAIMQINVSELPYFKVAMVVVTLFFGYRLLEINVVWNIQRSRAVQAAQAQLQQCNTSLSQANQRVTTLVNAAKAGK